MPASPNTLLIRAAEKEIFRRLSILLGPMQFKGKPPRTWTRSDGKVSQVFHLHRGGMTYGAPISTSVDLRVELYLRPAVDTPDSHHASFIVSVPPKGYHFSFNAKNKATFDRCITDLHRYCIDHADAWFRKALSEL